MFETIRSFLETLKGPSVEAQELAYLNDASDRYDLEYRQLQVDRGLFRKRQTLGGLPVFH